MATERVETTTGICFGNQGSLRRDYDVEEVEDLLDYEPPASIFPGIPSVTNVFRRGGPLRRVYCATDFQIIVGHTHEERFPYETDGLVELDGRSSQNGVHPDGVKGIL